MNVKNFVLYLIAFSVSISFISCSFKNSCDDAELTLMTMILFSENGEETIARRLKGVYEVKGELNNDSILHETAWGAAYVPHLVIKVKEIVKVDNANMKVPSLKSGENEYLELTCRQVNKGIHGIYEMDESIQVAIGQKVRVQGALYQCKDNWYICEKDETEVYCNINGTVNNSNHIELINLKLDNIK
jgi:hypothetical protein